jgi:serine acetyltransferase
LTTAARAFVHEKALCESDDVGAGTRIWAFAHVMKGARIGADCNICGHVFVEGGARIGDRVIVKNGVLIWDKVTLEDEVFVGPMAVFTNDPAPRAAFKRAPAQFRPTRVRHNAGNPTRRVGWMCACGLRLPRALACRCGRRYRRLSASAGLAAAAARGQPRSRARKA